MAYIQCHGTCPSSTADVEYPGQDVKTDVLKNIWMILDYLLPFTLHFHDSLVAQQSRIPESKVVEFDICRCDDNVYP